MSKITNLLMLPLICGLFMFFAACSNDKETTGTPPKVSIASSILATSSMVLHINIGQMLEKADYNIFKQTEMFKDALAGLKKENPAMVPFLKDPASTGINMQGDVALVMDLDPAMKGQEVTAIWPVADKAKVLDALKAAAAGEAEVPKIEEKEGYTLFSVKESEYIAIGDKVMAMMSTKDDAAIQAILNPTGEGIKANPSFAKHYNEGKDIMFWMSTTTPVKAGLKEVPFAGIGLGMAQIPVTDLEGNYITFYYDFLNGEVDGGGHIDFNESIKGRLGGLFVDKMTTDYSKTLPANDLLMAGTFALSLDGIISYLGNTGLANVVEPELQKSNLTLGKLKEMLVGDMAFSVNGGAEPSAVVAIGVKDEQKAADFINAIGAPKSGDMWVIATKDVTYNLQIADGKLLLATTKAALDAAMQGGDNKIVAELQEGWMGMHVNYEAMEANRENLNKTLDGRFSNISTDNMKDFKNMNFIMKGAGTESKIFLKDQSDNALKAIIQMMDKSYVEDKNREDEFEDFDDAFGEEEKAKAL